MSEKVQFWILLALFILSLFLLYILNTTLSQQLLAR
jgi:hypothetical protein